MEKSTFGLDRNIACALCYIAGWISGLIFFLSEKEDKLVRFHALQSIAVFVVLSAVYVVLAFFVGILFVIFAIIDLVAVAAVLTGLIYGLLGLVSFAAFVFLIYLAYSGKEFKIPFITDFVKKKVGLV